MKLTYSAGNRQLLDDFKTKAFVNGIRDSEVRLVVCSAQKTTFAETVTFALAQETAHTISTLQVSKLRRINVVKEKGCKRHKSRNMLKQIFKEVGQKVKLKCFLCGNAAHV